MGYSVTRAAGLDPVMKSETTPPAAALIAVTKLLSKHIWLQTQSYISSTRRHVGRPPSRLRARPNGSWYILRREADQKNSRVLAEWPVKLSLRFCSNSSYVRSRNLSKPPLQNPTMLWGTNYLESVRDRVGAKGFNPVVRASVSYLWWHNL